MFSESRSLHGIISFNKKGMAVLKLRLSIFEASIAVWLAECEEIGAEEKGIDHAVLQKLKHGLYCIKKRSVS